MEVIYINYYELTVKLQYPNNLTYCAFLHRLDWYCFQWSIGLLRKQLCVSGSCESCRRTLVPYLLALFIMSPIGLSDKNIS